MNPIGLLFGLLIARFCRLSSKIIKYALLIVIILVGWCLYVEVAMGLPDMSQLLTCYYCVFWGASVGLYVYAGRKERENKK